MRQNDIAKNSSVILLEFNELCPELVQRFMSEGHLPGFKRLYNNSEVYTTDAQEKPPELEPWIQWVTVHTGLAYREHGVFTLDEGQKVKGNQIWDHVSEQGASVWVCGSMNAGCRDDLQGYVLPDPWANDVSPYPQEEFADYYSFVQRSVQEHTNTEASSKLSATIGFVRFMATHGLSVRTISKIVRQLLREKLTGKFSWQRASILDWIQWDVFRHYWKRERPALATFFLNSTAHYQHVFWRNFQPELFKNKPSAEEQAEYEGAVLHGYKNMDRIINECLDMAGDDTAVILLTALSQQPCLTYEETGGKTIYRPHTLERLLDFVGIDKDLHCGPLMSEQFLLRMDTAAAAQAAADQFNAVMMDGKPLLAVEQRGTDVVFGCGLFSFIDTDPVVTAPDGKEVKFSQLFYNANEIKSGMHHPDGLFWVCEPGRAHRVHDEHLPLTEVTPTIYEILGLPKDAGIKAVA